MAGFKEKLVRFMYGRYGFDHLSKMMMVVACILLVISMFWYNPLIYFPAMFLVVYAYFRALSKNTSKRYAENEKYLRIRYKVIGKYNVYLSRLKDKKTHKIFKCPSCSQKIRIPRGKGKILIKCPKCRIEFEAKS